MPVAGGQEMRINTNHLADFQVMVSAPLIVGDTGLGERRVVAITGGRVQGARLNGTILPGGSDDQRVGADGVTHIHARYVIKTDDGALIYMESQGLRVVKDPGRAQDGGGNRPSASYFVTGLRFEAAAAEHRWLERRFFIAKGERRPEGVFLAVFEIA